MTDAPATAAQVIDALTRRNADLQRRGQLTDERTALDDLGARIVGFAPALTQVRTRGYCFRNGLEARIQAMADQWPAALEQARAEADRQLAGLRIELQRTDNAVRILGPQRNQPLDRVQPGVTSAEAALQRLDERIRTAGRAVSGLVDASSREASALARELRECEKLLDARDAATFEWQPDEAIVAAVEAAWQADERKDPVPGTLFLSDMRLLFERREKVAKKKILFITTESELVCELAWEAPLSAVEEVVDSEARRALILKKELLTVRLASGSPREAVLQLDADSEAWRVLIRRAVSHELDAERVGAGGAAPAPAPRYMVPAKCPSCGAAVAAAGIVRGAQQITCEYCGATIPLTPVAEE